jgi:hypothetical protein
MKRIYEKPAFTKSQTTLQAVTAANGGITGPGNGGIDVGDPEVE